MTKLLATTFAISLALFASNADAQVFGGLKRSAEEARLAEAKRIAKEAADKAAAAKAKAEAEAKEDLSEEAKRLAEEKREREAKERKAKRLEFIKDALEKADDVGKDLYRKFKKDVLDELPKGTMKHLELYLQAAMYEGCGQRFEAETTYNKIRKKTPPEVTSNNLHDAAYLIVEKIRGAEHIERYYKLDALHRFRLDYEDWERSDSVRKVANAFKRNMESAANKMLRDIKGKEGYDESVALTRSSALSTWADNVDVEWGRIWKAREVMLRSPNDPAAQIQFARLAASTDKALLNMPALTLLKDIIATYPDQQYVRNGSASNALADCYERVFDYDAAIKALQAGKTFVGKSRGARGIQRELDRRISKLRATWSDFKTAFTN